MSVVASAYCSLVQLKLARFQATKLTPTRPINSTAKAVSPRNAHMAIRNSPPIMNDAPTVNMMIVMTAVSMRMRYEALKAITESSSKLRCARSAVPNALIRRIAPKDSWIRDVTSEAAAR